MRLVVDADPSEHRDLLAAQARDAPVVAVDAQATWINRDYHSALDIAFLKAMTEKSTWFITGAGRGIGTEIAKAALAAGHAVVAADRHPDTVSTGVGEANAGDFFGGFFEELSPEQIDRQLATNVNGPMNVSRAVLRRRRSGHVISISSTTGLTGFEYCSVDAASKFVLESWMESLQPEVEPLSITTTIDGPGFFRTELLEPESTTWPELSIDDYAERNAAQREWWEAQNGQQGGDPAKLAQALLTIADQEQPPLRFMAGADSIELAEQKVAALWQQIDAFRDLSTSPALDELELAATES